MKTQPIIGIIIVLLFVIGLGIATFKITGILDWKWIWVTSPLWIDFLLCLILFIWIICVYKAVENIIN